MTQMLGGSVEGPLREALADNGLMLDNEQWRSLRPAFYSAIDRIVTPRTGARETLSALKEAGYQLALISNTYWAADLHDRHLAEYGLIEFFDVRVYSADTTHVKPHPSIFTDTLTALGVEPHEAAYVGDRPDIDVKGAQQVGMRGILIRSPYDQTPLGEIVPDAIIDELPELIPALERLELPA
jgi:HAD superfamily hydrolase (TIGR01509 family)